MPRHQISQLKQCFSEVSIYVGSVRSGDSETILDLKSGTIFGSARELFTNSSYEIMTPRGVANIRGGKFGVSVQYKSVGGYRVSFMSQTQDIFCSAVVNGSPVVKILDRDYFWTVGDKDITRVPPKVFREYLRELNRPHVL